MSRTVKDQLHTRQGRAQVQAVQGLRRGNAAGTHGKTRKATRGSDRRRAIAESA